MIRITQVRLDNFLSFQGSVVIKNIARISAFVGPNNSGKSNLFRCLSLYQELSKKSNEPEYISTDKVKNLQHQLAPFDPLFIEVKYRYENNNRSNDPLEIAHSISFNENGEYCREMLTFRRLSPTNNGIHEIEIFKVEKIGDEYKPYLQNSEYVNAFLSNTHPGRTPSLELTRMRSPKPFGWDWAKLGNPGMMIYGELINATNKWKFISANRARKNSEEFLHDQLGKEREETNALIDLIGKLTETHDIDFEKENAKIHALVGDLSSKQARFRLDQLGSGYEQIFILLPEIYQEFVDDTIFFIDEPEVHLHPHFQRRLLQYLIQRSANNQFLLATHSTIFCRQQDGLLQPYLVKKENDRTQIDIIENKKMEDIKSILGHVNTDLFGYNAVVFVEGYAEENALPFLAKNMEFDIVDYGIRILNSEGYGNMGKLNNIIGLLKSSGTEIYAMCDPHHEKQGKLKDLRDRIGGDKFVQLKVEFEDNFSDEVLMEAFSKFISNQGLSFDENDLKKNLATATSAFNRIKEEYHTRTNRTLSKAQFARELGPAVKKCDKVMESRPEVLLNQIRNNIENKLKIPTI